jgi:glycosyltransferase involved in cell wall biosynthesis
MRVVMLILEYHPITGGAQRQLASIAPLLRERGSEIEVWTRAVRGLARRESIDGVPVHRLGWPGSTASFAAEAAARLVRTRPDVLHAYSLFSPAAVALFARRALGVPTVVKVLRGGELGDGIRLRRKPFGALRVAGLARGIDRFLAISREIDTELAALGIPSDRRCFLPNGVDTERFQRADDRERAQLRARLAVGSGPLFVYAGRLVPEKRVEDLLSAWAGVRAADPRAELVVLGSGPCEIELRRMAPAGVQFPGDVPDVAPWLRAADVFVLPSRTEGLSNALLEAMAAGLAVVATAVGGAVDLIDDGHSGRLVAPGQPLALRDALVSVAADAALRARLGAAARERVMSGYALPVIADRLVHLYRELAAAPPARALRRLAVTRN